MGSGFNEIPGGRTSTKIFPNLGDNHGSQELVRLLQYMKESRIDNPGILVRDSRILELDQIVKEVKESEEWEAVKMNILEVGLERGRAEGHKAGLSEGICALIQLCQELGMTREETKNRLVEKFPSILEQADEYMEHYWK